MEQKNHAAIYARCSTLLGQDLNNQLVPLRAFAQQRGFVVAVEYRDEGVSGSKERRPGLDRLLKDAYLGKFSLVLVTALDRVGRDVRHTVNLLHELSTIGVSLVSQSQAIDFSTPLGKATLVWAGALQTGARSGELYALEWTDVDWDNRRLTVAKSWNGRLKQYKSTKSGYWREVPINTELERILKLLRAGAGDRKWVYPRMVDWQRGESARILRAFCQGIGIPSVRFHALRACFATQLLRDSVAPAVVMKVCGWNDLKTMQRYIRLAGIEIEGATDSLKILPPDQLMGRVVELFGAGNQPN